MDRTATALPRARPEELGIDPDAVRAFISAAASGGFEMHSLMVVRHGRVGVEGWWTPYRAEAPHQLHSLVKIFLVTATGIALDEGRFGIDDRLVDLFPDRVPENPDDRLADLRVRHLLTGTTGQELGVELYPKQPYTPDEFVEWFLALPFESAPGAAFDYNPPASLMLSAIIEKTAATTLPAYLEDRVLRPLGIAGLPWMRSWPARVFAARTEDLAKLGQLHLDEGVFGGRRILSRDWVRAATRVQVETSDWVTSLPEDWRRGYGFQFWMCRDGGYRIDGAFGQYCIVVPDADVVIAITGDMPVHGFLELVWDHLVTPLGVGSGAAPSDAPSDTALATELTHLAVPLPAGERDSPTAASIDGRRIRLEQNGLGARWVRLDFAPGECRVTLESAEGEASILCGLGAWIDGVTSMPGMPPRMSYVGDLRPVKVAASAIWTDPGTLEMHWRFYETAHSATVFWPFEEDRVVVEIVSSITGRAQWLLQGTLEARP